MSDKRFAELSASLGAYGSDFSKWPSDRTAGAREALLADPEFRREFDAERELDRGLAYLRAELDDEIRAAGAAERVRRRTLSRLAAGPLAGMRWRQIAAAVLIAGVLGGAMDLFLAERAGQTSEMAMLESLGPLDETDVQ